MKARLVPLYLEEQPQQAFLDRLQALRQLLCEEVEFLDAQQLGEPICPQADGVLLPDLSGVAYRMVDRFAAITLPIFVVTSEYGTMAMWDWELVHFLKCHGIQNIYAPYQLDQLKTYCRAVAAKAQLRRSRFLIFQDDPQKGMRPDIFKRFYWWEDSCARTLTERFGLQIEKRSYAQLANHAKQISDAKADDALAQYPMEVSKAVTLRNRRSAAKFYLAACQQLDRQPDVAGIGVSCMNEGFFSDTTPCYAWNRLFEERGILWACEGDLLTLATEYLSWHVLQQPVVMENLYPFVMGEVAIRHENIPAFPDLPDPDRYILFGHCGYLGCVPRRFASSWQMQPKVLKPSDPNAIVIDARLPKGPVTLLQMSSSLQKILTIRGELTDYVQFPGSNCLVGGLIRVEDGHRVVPALYSHHANLIVGDVSRQAVDLAAIFGMQIEQL